MAKKVNPIPKGYHSVTPYLMVKGAAKAIDFYKKAFGAKVMERCNCPETGLVVHAELKIGDSMVMLADEPPKPKECCGGLSPLTLKGTSVLLHLYVKNVDTAFKQAVKSGCKVLMPLTDMFWGDRFGQLQDPFGHKWALATHKEDLSKKEIEKRAKEFMKQCMAKKKETPKKKSPPKKKITPKKKKK